MEPSPRPHPSPPRSPLIVLLSTCDSVKMEPSSPKKIQFTDPPLQDQLDPQAAEHIRRRRPTPASPFQVCRQPETDVVIQQSSIRHSQTPNSSERKYSAHSPPSMKDFSCDLKKELSSPGSVSR
ncbi:protein phosphatase 1 regulatory subunit 1C-like [Eucyclogobius newberryi]|uniref:protein phosphatase 1 regulatory subunit 1C-like n=1 Tax=Eucyclogobius newberryi TaxID=166745 RepID=UPI003B5C53DA